MLFQSGNIVQRRIQPSHLPPPTTLEVVLLQCTKNKMKETADLITLTEEILNGKSYFFEQCYFHHLVDKT